MKNLKILSMNLGRRFVPFKDKGKRQYLMDFIKEEDYDIIMLQGNALTSNINFSKMDYNAIAYYNRMALLYNRNLQVCDTDFKSKVASATVICDKDPIVCINVNCESSNRIEDVFNVCYDYSSINNAHAFATRIVAGRFPKEVDINEFCDVFNLDDISTLVGQETHAKNNREMLNHFFISRNLEALNVHKLVGMTEVSKIGEAYPIEVTLKKVLK